MKLTNNLVNAKVSRVLSNNSINIDSGSIVFNNKWVNYKSTIFNVKDYIESVLVSPRTRFFQNRDYAIFLLIGVSETGVIQVVEGAQAKFTTILNAPLPTEFSMVPLVGLILTQDGSSDLNYGFKPITDSNLVHFSGTGNAINKNIVGIKGPACTVIGETGLYGITGPVGSSGYTGPAGDIGTMGPTVKGATGLIGAPGMTGINWAIHFPLENFIK